LQQVAELLFVRTGAAGAPDGVLGQDVIERDFV